MSSTIVSTRRIERVNPHPNADKLELAVVGGWQCCITKGKYKAGDLITYIPPDSVLPEKLAEDFGVAKFLSRGRIIPIRLRNEPSFGLIVDPIGNEGENVADKLGITKYQHPFDARDKEAMPSNPYFTTYTDIENMRNFPDIFEEGEEVIITEKIHGKNCRLGFVSDDGNNWERLAGGRTVQRKNVEGSIHWLPWSIQEISTMIEGITKETEAKHQVIVFGEVYGTQKKMKYGLEGKKDFCFFDIMIDGSYLDWDTTDEIAGAYGVENAPVLYRGPFSMAKVIELSKGNSTIPGASHIREGVVTRPIKERMNEKIGRVILKYVSDDFLCGDYDASSE